MTVPPPSNPDQPVQGLRYDALRRVSRTIAAHRDPQELFDILADELHPIVSFNLLRVFLYEESRHVLRAFVREPLALAVPPEFPPDEYPAWWVYQHQEPLILSAEMIETRFPRMTRLVREFRIQSHCTLPLTTANRRLGVLAIGSEQPEAYSEDEVRFLSLVADQIALAIDNALAYTQIAELKEKLTEEKLYLEEEIRSEINFEDIVGEGPTLRRALQQVETVAATDSTVLLLGETGSGKELIARAIHRRSRRSDRTFVKLNCAAIPTGLLESELFGHERGAFTGAIARKVGRVELADRGTLFLDEVGDIPLELQPKLLRVLQEREFERLGSNETKKVDVRLIAATHRDLAQMIDDGTFRSDLFYRLNVFPIRVPPLRERPEDIPPLVRHFTKRFAERLEKKIETIPASALKTLAKWHWPGNVRELENFIERAVILTPGSVLNLPIAELSAWSLSVAAGPSAAPGHVAERERIIRALKETRGRVSGPQGAAERLGLKRTTLISRMTKLGIDPKKMS
jgi:formate hydrogenlyase transcriptional activator